MVEVISIHVTKCAGSSLRLALEQAYAPATVFLMHGDNPANPISRTNIDPEGSAERTRQLYEGLDKNVQAIHGHLDVKRFRFISRSVRRITILRHPIERTISHYYFFRQDHPSGHPIRDYLLRNDLSLLEFARLPVIRNFYRQVFFGGVDRSELDFVSSIEALPQRLSTLCELLDREISLPRANVGSLRAISPVISDEVLEGLANLLTEDIEFYQDWTAY